MSDICDGESYKKHPLFSLKEVSLEILLYHDDLEVCNPLSSRSKIHKIGKIVFNCNKLLLFIILQPFFTTH